MNPSAAFTARINLLIKDFACQLNLWTFIIVLASSFSGGENKQFNQADNLFSPILLLIGSRLLTLSP